MSYCISAKWSAPSWLAHPESQRSWVRPSFNLSIIPDRVALNLTMKKGLRAKDHPKRPTLRYERLSPQIAIGWVSQFMIDLFSISLSKGKKYMPLQTSYILGILWRTSISIRNGEGELCWAPSWLSQKATGVLSSRVSRNLLYCTIISHLTH